MENFEEYFRNLMKEIGQSGHIVLSTSSNDHVTSRMMSFVVIGNFFYFQTDKNFTKYSQIMSNNQIALCNNNIQIEGLCYEEGKPADNEIFCESFKKYFPSSYEKYTLRNNEVLFRVEPYFIKRWTYDCDKPFIEKYDLKNKQFTRNEYIL